MTKKKYILFLILVISGVSNFMVAQQTMETATQAVLGENTADNSLGDHWYKFTPSIDGLLTITSVGKTDEDTYVYIYDSGANELGSSDDATSSQSEINIEVVSGNEYFIKWSDQYTSVSYNWDLSIRKIEAGVLCSNAIDAIEGTNNLDLTNGEKWLKYTPTIDGVLTLENTIDPNDNWVYIYDDCDGGYIERLRYKKENMVVEANKTYYFKCVSNTTSLEFNLSIRAIEAGDLCSNAIDAIEGTNNLDLTTGEKWLKYTPSIDGVLILENAIDPNYGWAILYNDCDSWSSEYYYNKKVSLIVEANQTYYFKCEDRISSLEFNLSIRAIEEGDLCSNAFEAVEGTNNIDLSNGTKWVKYTPTIDGMLVLDNAINPDNYWAVLYDDCNGWDQDYYYNKKESMVVVANQTYYFKCVDNATSLEFNLSIRAIEAGDICSNAIIAIDGENSLSMDASEKYFSYQATSTGIMAIKLQNRIERVDFEIYNDCDSHEYEVKSIDGYASIMVNQGDQFIIKWYSKSDVAAKWNITITPSEIGDICSEAVEISLGDQTSDLSGNGKWFFVNTPSDGILEIKSNSINENVRLTVVDNCNDYKYGYGESNEFNPQDSKKHISKIIYSEYSDYQYVYIDDYNNSSEFNWSITVREYIEGETPENTKEAVLGTNTVTNSVLVYNYYTYTASTTGELSFATNKMLKDVFVYISPDELYDEDGMLHRFSDTDDKFLIDVVQGETYYFAIGSEEMHNNFTWELSYVTELGNTDYNNVNNVTIYPLPTVDELNIEISNTIESIEIYDITGIKVYSEIDVNSNSNKVKINLNSGSYIIRISDVLGNNYSKIILIQ